MGKIKKTILTFLILPSFLCALPPQDIDIQIMKLMEEEANKDNWNTVVWCVEQLSEHAVENRFSDNGSWFSLGFKANALMQQMRNRRTNNDKWNSQAR